MVINKDNYIGVYNMTTEKIKRMLDACYQAKRIRELLPPLPQGVTPSYIQHMVQLTFCLWEDLVPLPDFLQFLQAVRF